MHMPSISLASRATLVLSLASQKPLRGPLFTPSSVVRSSLHDRQCEQPASAVWSSSFFSGSEKPNLTDIFKAYRGTKHSFSPGIRIPPHCSLSWNSARPSTSPVPDTSSDMATSASERPLANMFPPLEPYRTGTLQVSPVHSLYWEESGNPNGQPVVFLHGGPGGGTTGNNRRFFDPAFYRIVLFDQRGAGKSTPHACLEDNTTWHLVSDIEALRRELKIDKWLVFGGSWGSTLSLAYAITHPEAVLGLVLRGIFLLRKKEIEWFYQSGADSLFPDVFEPYANFIPEQERHDLVTAYNRRLMNDSNPDMQIEAARHWTDWEMRTSYLVPNESRIKQGEDDKFALAFARIENHYFYNKGFFSSDNFILENIHKIRHLPCIIVQGRYDVVCPFRSAWDLHQSWPESEFRIVPDAGHSANELGITSELVYAMEAFKGKLKAN